MSTDWGIGCRTCQSGVPVGTPSWERLHGRFEKVENCRDPRWLALIVAQPKILELAVALHSFHGTPRLFITSESSSLHYLYDAILFAAEHTTVGHEVAVQNEWGDFFDEPIVCDHCHAPPERCRLPKGHEPPCK